MTTQFDPEAFLSATVSEPNKKRAPLPVENPDSPDGFYTSILKAPTVTSGAKDGKPWIAVKIPHTIQVPASLQTSLELPPEITLTDSAFLDITPQGTLDNSPGKNRAQKAYREALDLNKPGDTWSWRLVEGRILKVKIDNEVYEGEVQDRIGKIFPAN